MGLILIGNGNGGINNMTHDYRKYRPSQLVIKLSPFDSKIKNIMADNEYILAYNALTLVDRFKIPKECLKIAVLITDIAIQNMMQSTNNKE